ncbi:response regulator [Natronospira bacteriovora]|uniref:Response regulator n=1 Tax=Natronospira bacteriovora TaxID=3069753 RepID=A0ABU0W5W7_9GAMM|nr:response regulator [Natronospira sp. AB-CW4]MDQ2069416.1 response regulator [Natronospira sp. AB-CW4]
MKTIYLVDDSGTIRMSMATIMERAGCKVETANDGQEALERLRNGFKPDLLITDVHMPRMDGLTLIREARALPAHARTPILVLTTESQQEKKDEARRNGATGWMVKPVTADNLRAVLGKLLNLDMNAA